MTVGPAWDTASDEERGLADAGDEHAEPVQAASVDAPHCDRCGGILLRNVTGERVLRCPSCCREPAPLLPSVSCAGCGAQRAEVERLTTELARMSSHGAYMKAKEEVERLRIKAVHDSMERALIAVAPLETYADAVRVIEHFADQTNPHDKVRIALTMLCAPLATACAERDAAIAEAEQLRYELRCAKVAVWEARKQ